MWFSKFTFRKHREKEGDRESGSSHAQLLPNAHSSWDGESQELRALPKSVTGCGWQGGTQALAPSLLPPKEHWQEGVIRSSVGT